MNKLQVKQYVESGGAICPFCGSNNIEGSCMEAVTGQEISLEVSCPKCNKTWKDYYKLYDIEETY